MAGKTVRYHSNVSIGLPDCALQEYFSTMPWLAVPFLDDQLRSVLTRKFNVSLPEYTYCVSPLGKHHNPTALAQHLRTRHPARCHNDSAFATQTALAVTTFKRNDMQSKAELC